MGDHEGFPRSSHVVVEALADCPFSIADEYAIAYLRAAEADGPEATIRVPWALPLPLGHRVAITFAIHRDESDAGRPHDELRVRWTSGSPLLPDFHGTVRFRMDGARTRVLVEGSYAVPLGVPGRAFDALAGHWIARASMHDLADRIARHLTAQEAQWRRRRLPGQPEAQSTPS